MTAWRAEESVGGEQSRLYGQLAWIAVVIGVLSYLYHYLGHRSLWLDEAMLALNVKLLSYPELSGKLDYGQLAPVGWLYAEKALYKATGSLEYGLRLLPVIASISGLVLFRQLAFRAIGGFGALAAVIAFVISAPMIRYAAEAKPYSSDIALSVAAMLACVVLIRGDRTRPLALAAFAAIGFLIVIGSFSAVYVLAACGIAAFLAFVLQKRWISAGITAAIGLAWLVLFLYLFLQVYSPQLKGSDLTEGGSAQFFSTNSYAPLPPKSFHDIAWYGDWGKSFLTFMFRVEALFPAAALVIVGAFAVFRRSWLLLLIALGPLAIGMVASGFKLYPLFERLALFAAPGLWLMIGAGAGLVVAASKGVRIGGVVLIGLVAAGSTPYIVGNLIKIKPPFAQHEVRPVLTALSKQAQAGDVIYVANNAIPAYLLYRREYGLALHAWTAGRTPSTQWKCFLQEAPLVAGPQRMWVVFTFNAEEQYLDDPLAADMANIGRTGQIKQVIRAPGAYLYVVDSTPIAGWSAAGRTTYPCGFNEVNNHFDAPARMAQRLRG